MDYQIQKDNVRLGDLHFRDNRTAINLLASLNRCAQWTNFDESQLVQPCCNAEKLFTGYFGLSHHFGFTAFDHTLDETIRSPYKVDPVPFCDLHQWALSVAGQS